MNIYMWYTRKIVIAWLKVLPCLIGPRYIDSWSYVTMCLSHCGIHLGSSHKALYSRMHWCVTIYWIATCHMIYHNVYHSALYSVCICVRWKPGSRLPSHRLVLYLSCYICRHYRNLSHHCTVWRVEVETKWQQFAEITVKCILSNENIWMRLKLRCSLFQRIQVTTSLVLIAAWRRARDKPSSQPMFYLTDAHMPHPTSAS